MKCNRCGNIVYKSNEVVKVADGYSYYCNNCNEDLYEFEVSKASLDKLLTKLINLVRDSERFALLCENGIVMSEDLETICDKYNLYAEDSSEAMDEISAMIDDINSYIKQLENINSYLKQSEDSYKSINISHTGDDIRTVFIQVNEKDKDGKLKNIDLADCQIYMSKIAVHELAQTLASICEIEIEDKN